MVSYFSFPCVKIAVSISLNFFSKLISISLTHFILASSTLFFSFANDVSLAFLASASCFSFKRASSNLAFAATAFAFANAIFFLFISFFFFSFLSSTFLSYFSIASNDSGRE